MTKKKGKFPLAMEMSEKNQGLFHGDERDGSRHSFAR